MPAKQQLTITLPAEMAQMIRDKVASGEYASESDVIADGLLTLSERDEGLEAWLRDEVAPTIKALDDGSMGTVSLEEASQRFHARLDAMSGKASSRT